MERSIYPEGGTCVYKNLMFDKVNVLDRVQLQTTETILFSLIRKGFVTIYYKIVGRASKADSGLSL